MYSLCSIFPSLCHTLSRSLAVNQPTHRFHMDFKKGVWTLPACPMALGAPGQARPHPQGGSQPARPRGLRRDGGNAACADTAPCTAPASREAALTSPLRYLRPGHGGIQPALPHVPHLPARFFPPFFLFF